MAAVPIVLMAVSATMAAASAMKQSQAQTQAANYNATVATQNVNNAASQAAAASDLQSRQAERQMGAEVAAYGAAGVDPSQGSAQDVLSNSAQMATLNNLTTQYNYKLQGIGYQDQANLDVSEAKAGSSAGYLNAIGGVVGGASSGYRQGMFGNGPAIPQFGGNGGPGSIPTGMNYPGT